MAAVVEVKLELGHKAKVRDFLSPKGHTHDWVVFVKGADNIKLDHFVEKVVFWLHEDYEPSKRVIRREPHTVAESGFAGFIILIDVHFKNHEEPKMVRFQYDLFLHMEGMPPVNHTRLEKLTFTNPTEDFRKKLLKAGALLISPPPNSRHSSKERSSRTSSSPPSKKERSRSKDSLKHRDGSSSSSHRTHDEKKRSSSAHSVKKDGRLPGKDMKKHEEFKHPKPPDIQRTHKDSSGSEKIEHERGRPEKRRSVADDDGNKRKKKKHSDDRQSPSQQSRPKSLGITPVPVPQNLVKKEKEKVRKIQEKPDIMAGLFAPENSINMTQVKQSKEKIKVEANVKKDKKTTPSTTPSTTSASRSVSPYPGNEEPKITHSSKVSPGGNLTLKIKKERITSVEKEKKDATNKPIKSKKKESSEKEKRHSKESSEFSSKSRMKERNLEPKRRTSITSSDSSSSSSSGSDMDISSDIDSLPNESKRKSKMTTNSSIKSQKLEHKPKPQVHNKERERMIEKVENRMQNSNGDQGKLDKIKTERLKDSPKTIAITERHEKPRRNSSSQQEKRKSSSSSKQKKSSRDEGANVSLDKSTSESSSIHKSKKLKRSSKEKSVREPSKERKISTPTAPPPPLVKKEKRGSTPSSTPTTERISVKREQAYQTPPPSSNRGSVSPSQSIKSKKLPKPPSKEKEKKSRKQKHSIEKSKKSVASAPSKKQSLISTPKQEKEQEKPKITYKSRSFVETSSDSDSDSDIEPSIVKTAPQDFNKISENSRKDSISSQSSSSSQDSHSHMSPDLPHMSPDLDKNPHPDPCQENHHSPDKIEENSPPTSCSESSDEEERAMRDFAPNTSALTVISPIRDQSPAYNNSIENPSDTGTATAYQDMQMSESSDDDSEPHPPPVQVKVKEHPPPAWKEENRPHPLHHIGGITNDEYTSSDEDSRSPPEKPFQHVQDDHDESAARSSVSEKPRTVITLAGENGHFPHMTEKFYNQLQELQKRISYETDVERLRNIACIVAKSHKLLKNDDYFDFDLCSLDQRTIHKIQQQLSAK